jgi:uncharacterized protein (TIGR03118 family)
MEVGMKRFYFVFALLFGLSSAAFGDFDVLNLVTDDQSVNSAKLTDASLVNAWGIAASPISAFWVSANGSGVSDVYRVDPVSNFVTKVAFNGAPAVTIPGDGSVTGQVFNSNAAAFNGNVFLFVSEDGTVSGWRSALVSAAETLQTGSTANVYKGTTQATTGGNTYLYAANFRAGTIDILKGTAGAPNLTGNFTDPNLPAGYAPFNIQNLNDKLYVTYAFQDVDKKDDVAGAGNGVVDVFDLQGNLLNRIAAGGSLNSPWGLAIAPATFSTFANDLLVGNFGDGKISAFDPTTFAYLGQLTKTGGQPLSIDGLWALRPGSGSASGGSAESIYFSAGPVGESHGLFGAITPVPEPAALIIFVAGAIPGFAWAWAVRRKKR